MLVFAVAAFRQPMLRWQAVLLLVDDFLLILFDTNDARARLGFPSGLAWLWLGAATRSAR